jgi:hypothetical protein
MFNIVQLGYRPHMDEMADLDNNDFRVNGGRCTPKCHNNCIDELPFSNYNIRKILFFLLGDMQRSPNEHILYGDQSFHSFKLPPFRLNSIALLIDEQAHAMPSESLVKHITLDRLIPIPRASSNAFGSADK